MKTRLFDLETVKNSTSKMYRMLYEMGLFKIAVFPN